MAVPDTGVRKPKLSAHGVSKTFRNARGDVVSALGEVNLDIGEGEFVCLIGPSGCGKTTLLNLFAGLDQPDTGGIEMDGRPITSPGPDRAMLFQDPALFPWLNVRGNVEFALELIGVPKDERPDRAMHWLRKVHLGRFANAQPHELSGGMRSQAASRGRAQPEVCSPTGRSRPGRADAKSCRPSSGSGRTRNTFVFVTHNVREAVFWTGWC